MVRERKELMGELSSAMEARGYHAGAVKSVPLVMRQIHVPIVSFTQRRHIWSRQSPR